VFSDAKKKVAEDSGYNTAQVSKRVAAELKDNVEAERKKAAQMALIFEVTTWPKRRRKRTTDMLVAFSIVATLLECCPLLRARTEVARGGGERLVEVRKRTEGRRRRSLHTVSPASSGTRCRDPALHHPRPAMLQGELAPVGEAGRPDHPDQVQGRAGLRARRDEADTPCLPLEA
jgi:hypothetical protein